VGAFALFTFGAMFLKPPYRIWGALFFLSAMAVAYSRMYLAAHFFEDVYAGSLMGAGFSMLTVSVFYKTTLSARK
jgi:membrane-associated phospholipid phosphatase